jgi:hypothetical protein
MSYTSCLGATSGWRHLPHRSAANITSALEYCEQWAVGGGKRQSRVEGLGAVAAEGGCHIHP